MACVADVPDGDVQLGTIRLHLCHTLVCIQFKKIFGVADLKDIIDPSNDLSLHGFHLVALDFSGTNLFRHIGLEFLSDGNLVLGTVLT